VSQRIQRIRFDSKFQRNLLRRSGDFMEIIPAKLLRIYLKEEDKYEKEPLLELIVKILKKK